MLSTNKRRGNNAREISRWWTYISLRFLNESVYNSRFECDCGCDECNFSRVARLALDHYSEHSPTCFSPLIRVQCLELVANAEYEWRLTCGRLEVKPVPRNSARAHRKVNSHDIRPKGSRLNLKHYFKLVAVFCLKEDCCRYTCVGTMFPFLEAS